MNLSSAEQVINWTVTPRMIVVQGREAVFGFQSDLARWKRKPWGAGEIFVKSVLKNRVGVVMPIGELWDFRPLREDSFRKIFPPGIPFWMCKSMTIS